MAQIQISVQPHTTRSNVAESQSQDNLSSHDWAVMVPKELDTRGHTVTSEETLVLQKARERKGIILTTAKLSSESQGPSPNKVQHTCRERALPGNSVPIPLPPTPTA